MSKTSESRKSEDPASKVYMEDKIFQYFVYSLAISILCFVALCFIGYFQSEFEPMGLVGIGILISLVVVVVSVIGLVMMSRSPGGNGKSEKRKVPVQAVSSLKLILKDKKPKSNVAE